LVFLYAKVVAQRIVADAHYQLRDKPLLAASLGKVKMPVDILEWLFPDSYRD
jgi:hypothetical protein